MQRISRREFVKRTAVTSAAFTSLPAFLAACGTSTTSNKPSSLTIAAVQGAEDGPLKKIAPIYKSQTGITLNIVEFPYPDLYSKLVTTFQANGSSYQPCMMDDAGAPTAPLNLRVHTRLGHPRRGLRRGHLAAAEWSGAAQRAGQNQAPLWDHDRRQRRDVHVPQGHRLRATCVVGRRARQCQAVQQVELLRLRDPRPGHQPGEQRLAAHPLVIRRQRLRRQLEGHARLDRVDRCHQLPDDFVEEVR